MNRNLKDKFYSNYPGVALLSVSEKEELEHFLKSEKFIAFDENLKKVSKAGDGNMNFVLRVVTNRNSFIVKQARPWVEKYPQIVAPIERVDTESKFYFETSKVSFLAEHTPKIIGYIPQHFILVIEDLGECSDYMHIYKKGNKLSKSEIQALVHVLAALHNIKIQDFPSNENMRLLNHEHIFHYPFKNDNGLDLDSIQFGLKDLASSIYKNQTLVDKIHRLGARYLENTHGSLLHGDFYPGSWLATNQGLKIIDPEFCYIGNPAFDLGVFIGHMFLSRHSNEDIKMAIDTYSASSPINENEVYSNAAIEVLRRLFGIAQLPLDLSMDEKKELCQVVVPMV